MTMTISNYQRPTALPKYEDIRGTYLVYMTKFSVIPFSLNSGLQNKEEKIYSNLQEEQQIAAICKRLPSVLQYARVQTNNKAQSLFPHLLSWLINDYTVTANRLLIPYAWQRIDNH